MPDKPTIYRITHLWPNKQPGQGLTAQIKQQEPWKIQACPSCGSQHIGEGHVDPFTGCSDWWCEACDGDFPEPPWIEVAPIVHSSTVQIKPETDELNALPSRFVSLQDYERLERVGHRVLILDDAEPGEVSEAHVAVIGELRAALSSEATKGET